MFDASQRARYSRHLLLPEIGEAGQRKLLSAKVRVIDAADSEAAIVTLDYLRRAGVDVDADVASPNDAASVLQLPHAAAVDAVAGEPALRESSAFLLGAFAAVEAIKQITGAGSAGAFPLDFVLAEKA